MRWNPGTADDLYVGLVGNVFEAGATPVIVVRDSAEEARVREVLGRARIAGQPRYVQTPTNSAWIRDYGAIPILHEGAMRFYDFRYMPGMRPMDDTAAGYVWSSLSLPFKTEVRTSKMMLEGGDFVTDGLGTIFTSRRVAGSNLGAAPYVNAVMENHLGARRTVYLPHLTLIPPNHIDMYLKLADEQTLLLGELTRQGFHDPALERAVADLSQTRSFYGEPYRIRRVPMRLEMPAGKSAPVILSYTNALTVNDRVLVPQYGIAEDAEALAVYAEVMPDYRIVGLDCREPILEGGAIHCLTREIPDPRNIRIAHRPVEGPIRVGASVLVEAFTAGAGVVEGAWLYTRAPGETAFMPVALEIEGDRIRVRWTPDKPGRWAYYLHVSAGDDEGYGPAIAAHGGSHRLDVCAGVEAF
jgi:agmatine deiminase